MVRTTITLAEDEFEELKRLAARQDRTISWLLRHRPSGFPRPGWKAESLTRWPLTGSGERLGAPSVGLEC